MDQPKSLEEHVADLEDQLGRLAAILMGLVSRLLDDGEVAKDDLEVLALDITSVMDEHGGWERLDARLDQARPQN